MAYYEALSSQKTSRFRYGLIVYTEDVGSSSLSSPTIAFNDLADIYERPARFIRTLLAGSGGFSRLFHNPQQSTHVDNLTIHDESKIFGPKPSPLHPQCSYTTVKQLILLIN
jgi:hypothetical protein